MMNTFGIQIEDGSLHISEFVSDENIKTIELHDWQRDAIKYFFNNNCKSIFSVTTGAGKTFCAIEIIKRIWKINPKCKVLIVVPKNVILETGWHRELYNAGISLRDIGVYYGNIKEYSKVTITNMQNLQNISLNIFDAVIFDEIHNYCTPRLFPIISKQFKYKIGLSATIERMDGKHYKLLKIFDYNVFYYSPKQALHDGVLNPFNFYNIGVSLDGDEREEYELLTSQINTILQAGGGYKKIMFSKSGLKLRLLSKMTNRTKIVNNYFKKVEVVQQIVEKHKQDKIIIFNQFNKQTSKFYWHLLEVGVKACVIHSDLPKEKREQNLLDFSNDKYSVVLASRVLDEGYNLPKIDVGIIAAGNSTSKQTIQRMGRVLRRKDHPSNLYQIYCINTIEDDYAFERAKIFKDLCREYKDYEYNDKKIEW